jgi:hypothetical protein
MGSRAMGGMSSYGGSGNGGELQSAPFFAYLQASPYLIPSFAHKHQGQSAEAAGSFPFGFVLVLPLGQVKSRVNPRDTWSKRQAGVLRSVRRAGWVWAASCTAATKIPSGKVAKQIAQTGFAGQLPGQEARSSEELEKTALAFVSSTPTTHTPQAPTGPQATITPAGCI